MPPVSYNLTTDVGKVRLLIPDRDVADPAFSDEEIDVFLTEEGSIRAATALALEIAAVDDVRRFKITKTGQDSVDGVRGSELLLKRAALLRSTSDDLLVDYAGHVGYTEMGIGVFGARERFWNEVVRRRT
jgi:hypothetical protein